MIRPMPTDRANRILEITRTYDAPREEVFRYLVEPALIAQWWGPDGFSTPVDHVLVEARPGGPHRKTMVLESAEIAAGMGVPVGTPFPDSAVVLEILPPELLVLTSEGSPRWAWSSAPSPGSNSTPRARTARAWSWSTVRTPT